MSWDMVRMMACEGVHFGGHGVTHRLLTTLGEGAVREEVTGARDRIWSCLGVEPLSFAYPDGKRNPMVARQLQQAGFTMGFSTEGGYVARGDDPTAIRRVNIHEAATGNRAMFLAQLVGIF